MMKLLSFRARGTAGSAELVDRALTAWVSHYERLFCLNAPTGSR